MNKSINNLERLQQEKSRIKAQLGRTQQGLSALALTKAIKKRNKSKHNNDQLHTTVENSLDLLAKAGSKHYSLSKRTTFFLGLAVAIVTPLLVNQLRKHKFFQDQ